MLRIWHAVPLPQLVLLNLISEAFKKTIKKFGYLNIVVNNAGLCNEKNWKYVVSVNLVSKKMRLYTLDAKNYVILCFLKGSEDGI
jgi:short-subunit dehydrogenase involved in D-alanine esterification of teichoic acids